MEKQEMFAHMGSIQQEVFVRPVTYTEGRARGLDGYLVKNGALRFTVLSGKCLDIGELEYKGVGFHFLSKPGLTGRDAYDTRGQEARRSIMGGFFFTCGLENICAPCISGGKEYPMHGRMRSTPAEHVSADAAMEDGAYRVTIGGEMRESELFGENMILRRKITTRYGEKSIHIRDEIENQSFRPEPLLLMYHINIGYPLLTEGTRLILPTREIMPRDTLSAKRQSFWNRMPAPIPNEPEAVFTHRLSGGEEGNTYAAVVNETLGLGVKLEFRLGELPYFHQWLSAASGDYVLGLEPANARVSGRPGHEENGDVPILEPMQTKTTELTFTILEGEEIYRMEEEYETF
ncbi:MAG: aldose 1-epimerase family protein [Oscillospiraceae bacterium]|nr:aldose 1-epimerase family protein [Oscillospiraceae bacterium]